MLDQPRANGENDIPSLWANSPAYQAGWRVQYERVLPVGGWNVFRPDGAYVYTAATEERAWETAERVHAAPPC